MRTTKYRQILYGVAAVVGLVVTAYFNVTYAGDVAYLGAWFANSASSSAAVDLIVAAVAASVFMVVEGYRLRMRVPSLYPVLGIVLAIAFAFPLFLLLRERALDRRGERAGEGGPAPGGKPRP